MLYTIDAMIPQFIGAFLVASVTMIAGSFVWPMVSKEARPPILEAVHDKVVETEAGRKVEQTLIAYTTTDLNQTVSSVSSQVVTQVGGIVQQKAEELVTERFIDEFLKRFDSLSPAEKDQVKAVICKQE
jgi:hypothetical protein